MREEYLAEEMNERDDLFEDIPDDELEEVEREARELRSWFENPDMWAGKSVHDYMEDGWSEDHWYEEDEDIDDSDVDIFTDEFDYDDASLLNLISEEPDESNEEMFEDEDDETLWKSDEEGVIEMDLDDPDVFAFLYMFYMEHADCTGCKMQEGDEI
ncbi:hypothetical protein [Blautia obeum]|uniref:hypothetical protein n=1 Tax=Blautia obeum TaxID=40520 RepID=UPI001D06ADE1|nr:hypothetical protein [Blautia obeum]MCB7341985.1 hypothetical protein [Blautia obeum]